MTLRPVSDSHTLSAKVVEQIRLEIADRRYRPGERLPSERELADVFRVSRTVVRDAVKVLSGIGVITVRQGVGAFVNEVGAQEAALQIVQGLQGHKSRVLGLFEVRKVLEAEGAAWAAMRSTPEGLEALASQVRASMDAVLRPSFDPDEAREHNETFHLLVARISQNNLLPDVLTNLLRMLEGERLENLVDREWAQTSVNEHSRIVLAIRNRDPEAARWAMKQHLGDVEDIEITRLGQVEKSVSAPQDRERG